MARLAHTGYGQVEINNCAFRRDGRIEAQLPLDASVFADGIENGAIVGIDSVAGKLVAPANGIPALVYSAEKTYEDDKTGLKYFTNELDGFLPRVGILAIGDKFTTNTFDEGSALAVGDYCQAGADGIIADKGTSAITDGLVFRVIEITTMPDGQKAVKLQVAHI